jgi:putative inorganic carbon (HCO3(-)) transporter
MNVEKLYPCQPKIIWQCARSQHSCFWFLCGYLIFEYVRPQSIYPAIAFFPWTVTFALGAFLTSFVDPLARNFSANSIDKAITIFGIVVLLSCFASQYPEQSFANIDLFGQWVIVYFAIRRIVLNRVRFFLFFLLYLLCNLKMSQHGFLSWASRGFAFDNWGVTGAPGWFQNSGEFGIQLCMFVPLSLSFILPLRQYWGRLTRLVFYFMPVSGFGSVIATSSRGAILGLAAAGLWSIKASQHFWKSTIAAIFVAAFAFVATPAEFKDRFKTTGEDRTSLIRLDRWQKGMETLQKFPALGVGYKAWSPYYLQHLNYGPAGTALVHNMFIECVTETGTLGIISFGFLIYAMFAVTRRVQRSCVGDPGRFFWHSIAIGFNIALVGLLVSASFVTVLFYPYIWIHAAFASALYNATLKVE